ncbi:MFS transporter [Rugamonas sp. CCM 8940]|uniref:MFS transporter n=1 Tax=Rugamonas sp. CCM 8940 TaxID=2765359 RepID=UPI0018F76055|nr:MFS transporter [Rugamonas sp. CCM 8940]MBJ7310359.1 MFS transporter [Rugamonas sp. CCM 8940]
MPESAAAGGAQAALRTMDKVIVAIHGVGSQQRSETIRRVTTQFSAYSKPRVALMPLGFFYVDKVGQVKVSQLDVPADDALDKIGFAEVFWADIPKKVDKDSDTLEEIKAWGRTVVSRAEAAYGKVNAGTPRLDQADFQLGAAVIEEIIETVAVLENLLFIADKMGLFKFDLAPVLREYVGDVQVVAEFRFFRERIVYRFHKAMHDVIKACHGAPEVYVVAHSEGTVVAFLAMLEALSRPPGTHVVDPDDPTNEDKVVSTDWIDAVRGFMTIGSPIDKHLVLWPQMWSQLNPSMRQLQHKIKWRNYYDHGDPIGFKLDTAKTYLDRTGCQAFDFHSDPERDDFGFSRYWLPGKAHNDYWTDNAVFDHFIRSVVRGEEVSKKPQGSKLVGAVSTSLPYLLSAALHLAAVFLLFKALLIYLEGAPPAAPAAPAAAAVELILLLTRTVFCLGGLLLGVTVVARVPRLVNRWWKWLWLPVLFGVAMAGVYWLCLPDPVARALSTIFQLLLKLLLPAAAYASLPPPGDTVVFGKGILLGVAAVLGCSGWVLKRNRRRGRRTLIAAGATAVLLLVVLQIVATDSQDPQPVWPLVLAGAAFLYLWWLGILVFDLAFIWHRYIRHSVAAETLHHWYQRMEAMPKTLWQILQPAGKGAATSTAADGD